MTEQPLPSPSPAQSPIARHTPGPWDLYRDEDRNAIAVSKHGTGPNGGWVAWSLCRMPVPSKRLTWDEINANARLIAAAPELLEALVNCVSLVSLKFGNTDDGANAAQAQARAAISKATGSDQ